MPITGRLARQLITTCSRAGDLVVDVHPADHMVVVNAVVFGRRVSAVVVDHAVAGVIWTRAISGRDIADRHKVEVRVARAEAAYTALAYRRGEAALVVVRRTCEAEPNTTSIDGSPGESPLIESAALLAPGGHLVVVTGMHLIEGRPRDPMPGLIGEAQRAGLVYLQHIVAVHGPIRRRQIVLSLLPAHIAARRTQAVSPHVPMALRAHADVLIFSKPLRSSASAGSCPGGEEHS